MTPPQDDRYRALYAVARAINSTLDESAVLRLVSQTISAAVGVKGCALRLLSDHGTLDLVAASLGVVRLGVVRPC